MNVLRSHLTSRQSSHLSQLNSTPFPVSQPELPPLQSNHLFFFLSPHRNIKFIHSLLLVTFHHMEVSLCSQRQSSAVGDNDVTWEVRVPLPVLLSCLSRSQLTQFMERQTQLTRSPDEMPLVVQPSFYTAFLVLYLIDPSDRPRRTPRTCTDMAPQKEAEQPLLGSDRAEEGSKEEVRVVNARKMLYVESGGT